MYKRKKYLKIENKILQESLQETEQELAAEKAAHEATKSACGEELTGQSHRIGELVQEIDRLKELIYQKTDEHAEDLRTIRKMNKETSELMQEIATEREKAEQLRHLLAAANEKTTHAEADKRRLQGENRALREKIDEAQRQSTCPADCVHRTSPNTCRTCTRYPKAKDKYEVTE
jgi:chromosome segregation ATPase